MIKVNSWVYFVNLAELIKPIKLLKTSATINIELHIQRIDLFLNAKRKKA